MKRIITFILVLCLLIPVGAISVFADSGSSWELTEFVDDFGDPTDEAYLRSIVSGTFSNTATTDEDMKVIIGYSPDDAVFMFRLVEYDDTLKVKATYTDGDSKTIKIKIGDEITEGTLIGTPPNGDLLLTGGSCLINIYNALVDGLDVRFIVEIAGSKYSFLADGKGFSENADEYWAQNPDKSNGLYYPGTELYKLDYFLGKINGNTVVLDDGYTYKISYSENEIGDAGVYYTYKFSPTDGNWDKDWLNRTDPGLNYRQMLFTSYEEPAVQESGWCKQFAVSNGFPAERIDIGNSYPPSNELVFADSLGNKLATETGRSSTGYSYCYIMIVYA